MNTTTAVPKREQSIQSAGFVLTPLQAIPPGSRQSPKSTVIWFSVDCGDWARLVGAAILYETQEGKTVALVTGPAELRPFGNEDAVSVEAGLWQIEPPE